MKEGQEIALAIRARKIRQSQGARRTADSHFASNPSTPLQLARKLAEKG